MVEVLESPSIFFNGMAGSRMPIAVAHGEGFAEFSATSAVNSVLDKKLVDDCALLKTRLVWIIGQRQLKGYPFNPNGSPQGITGLNHSRRTL